MFQNTNFNIYIYLNSNLILDDRTATGVANAMRISKDRAGKKLQEMVSDGLLEVEPVGNLKLYFIKIQERDQHG